MGLLSTTNRPLGRAPLGSEGRGVLQVVGPQNFDDD